MTFAATRQPGWFGRNSRAQPLFNTSLARNGDFSILHFGPVGEQQTTGVLNAKGFPKWAADRWFFVGGPAGGGLPAAAGHGLSFVANPIPNSGGRRGLKYQRTATFAFANTHFLVQTFLTEESLPLVGRKIAASMWVKGGANTAAQNLQLIIAGGTGTNQLSSLFGSWSNQSVFHATAPITLAANEIRPLRIGGLIPALAGGSPVSQLMAYLTWNYPAVGAGADDSLTFTGFEFGEGNETPFIYRPKQKHVDLNECAFFYEDLARDPFGGLPSLRTLFDPVIDMVPAAPQTWFGTCRFQPKRHNAHTLAFSSKVDGYHITSFNAGSIWNLNINNWGHQSPTTALVEGDTTSGTPFGTSDPCGTLAVDGRDGSTGSTQPSKWAIDANL